MSKQKVKIGVVCLARKTFDYLAAQKVYEQTIDDLKNIEDVDWVFKNELVIEKEEAIKVSEEMAIADLDGIVIISGTFHLGHLALIIHRKLNLPALIWGFNELPYDGGKIRLNSVCGVNLNASNLYKAGYDNFTAHLGEKVNLNWIEALRMKVSLEKKSTAIVGFRADGFFNLATDELRSYNEAGVLIDHYEIHEMFDETPNEEQVKKALEEIYETYDCSGVTPEQVDKVAKLCATTDAFLAKNSIDGLAIRCWPEYARDYGIAPCAMMSLLQAKGKVLACEGDVEAAITMQAAKAIGIEAPFLADLSQVNIEKNFALMWHCGVAPACLWDGKSKRSLDTYFAGGKGVTADFVLKSGDINIIRIDSARGKTRVFIESGHAVEAEKEIKGTFAKIEYKHHISEVLDTVIENGIAHHVVVVYGDYIETFKLFAKMMNWELIEC